jgi:hypothetical protein
MRMVSFTPQQPLLRTKSIGFKVSQEEYAQLEAAASERGLTLSEWCRETLLERVPHPRVFSKSLP